MLIVAFLAAFAGLLFLMAEAALGPIGPFVKMIPAAALGVMVFQAGSRAGAKAAATGLLVSALADAVIEFSFLGGLGTFLLAHVFYIAAFLKVEPRLRLARLAPLALWAAAALPPLASGAGALRVPVLIYGGVIFVMIWRAAAAVSSASIRDPAVVGLLGAFLFGLSDTLLGYNRFVAPLEASHVLILGTYWAGQALIAASFLRGR